MAEERQAQGSPPSPEAAGMPASGEPGRGGHGPGQQRMRRASAFWTGPVLGLAVLAALMGVYAWLTHRPASPRPASTLLHVSLDQMTGLIMRQGSKSLLLYRVPSKATVSLGPQWRLDGPAGPQADGTLVGDFVSSLLTLQPSQVVVRHPTGAQLAAYGLRPPRASLQILRGKLPRVTLQVGAQSPIGGYYARLQGHSPVYLISTVVASEISANPNDWLPLPSSSSSKGKS